LGLARPNPGLGHPLRPEYILTPSGESVGPVCERVAGLIDGLGVHDIAYRKWFLPGLLAAHAGARRFGEYRAHLGEITDRALSFSLADLCAAAFVERTVRNGAPPVPWYEPTRAAAPVGAALAAASW